MASNGLPDLAAVLRTLSQTASLPQTSTSPEPRPQSQPLQLPPQQQSPSQLQVHHPHQPQPIVSPPASTPTPTPPISVSASTPAPADHSFPDPTTLTTWPDALKYVARALLASPSGPACTRIQALIREQHAHERAWWAGREAMLEQHRGRADKQRRLDEVLRAVGGVVTGGSLEGPTPEDDRRELAAYDRKVHAAARTMAAAFEGELVRLKVPFFAIRPEFVQPAGGDVGDKERAGPETKRAVSAKELASLRGRMLQLLEDMC